MLLVTIGSNCLSVSQYIDITGEQPHAKEGFKGNIRLSGNSFKLADFLKATLSFSKNYAPSDLIIFDQSPSLKGCTISV